MLTARELLSVVGGAWMVVSGEVVERTGKQVEQRKVICSWQ